jgi:hypothetical protein
MDRTARLIGEVAWRYGIRLDPDDPAFALVALNELALEDAAEKLAARMKQIATDLERSAESVGLRAGIAVAEQIRAAATTVPAPRMGQGEERTDADGRVVPTTISRAVVLWIAVGVSSGLVLFGLGLLVGARVL